jgi:hypothetical protein
MLHWPPKASKLGFLSSFNIYKKFLIDRVPSCDHALHLNFGTLTDDGQYGSMELKAPKLGDFEFFHHQYQIPNR